MGQTRAQRVIKELAGSVQKQTPIATDMFIPNHSGDNSAGDILKTPVNDTDIPNKKYVDDTIPLHDYGTEGSVAFLDANGRIDEENSEIFWDSVNKRMGLGTATTDRLYKLKIKQKAGEGGIWLENPAGNYGAYFIDNTNGIFKTQTQLGMAFRSQTGYVYFKSATDIYFDVGDALGVNEFKFRNRYGAEIAVLDSLGNLSVEGNVGINTTTPNAKLQVVGDTHLGADTTNYTEIKDDGEINLHGTARVKKEFAVLLTDFNPGASGPTKALHDIFPAYEFTIGDDLHTSFELPTDWEAGTDITTEVYWAIDEAYATNSGEVRWSANWRAVAVGELISGGASGTCDYGDVDIPATANTIIKTECTISGASLSQDDLIAFNGSRVALVGGNNPTAEPYIVAVRVKYISNKLGEAT